MGGSVLAHGSGIDDLLVFVVPVVVVLAFRLFARRKPDEDDPDGP
jgi:hypothetical protein